MWFCVWRITEAHWAYICSLNSRLEHNNQISSPSWFLNGFSSKILKANWMLTSGILSLQLSPVWEHTDVLTTLAVVFVVVPFCGGPIVPYLENQVSSFVVNPLSEVRYSANKWVSSGLIIFLYFFPAVCRCWLATSSRRLRSNFNFQDGGKTYPWQDLEHCGKHFIS